MPRATTIGTLILGSAALLTTAYCLAACLRLSSAVSFLLAAYLIAFAEVVAVCLLLSPGHRLTSTWLLSTLYAVWAVALLVWWGLALPRPPPFRPLLRSLREALRDPVLGVLVVALLGGLGYTIALIVGTAPNGYDVLWYHLARAAFWKQQHAVAYIPAVNTNRLNAFPPNAEIADAFTMVLGRTDRFVGFVEVTALGASVVGVGGVARRLGLGVREALFGAFAFATLPVVALQASTALNDLVLCSFLVCVLYFLLTWSHVSLSLAALALGLAIGTKLNSLLALPLLAVAMALVYPRRRWPAIFGVGVAGILFGCVWYLVNQVETGRLAGAFAGRDSGVDPNVAPARTAAAIVGHIFRLAIDAVDPAGALGRDWFVYLVAAGVLAVVLLTTRTGFDTSVAAGLLALLAFAVRPVQHGLLHAYQKAWIELGHRRIAFFGSDRHATEPSPFRSWYGPLGVLLVLAGLVLAWRRGLGRVAIALALLPAAWLVLQAIVTDYSLFDGRYLMFPVAAAGALWGLVLVWRPVAWAVAAVAVVTLLLSFVHYAEKPSGVAVLGGQAPESVWDQSRAQVMGRTMPTGEAAIVARLDRRAIGGQTVWLRLGREDVSYPFFGPDLDRRVVFSVPAKVVPDWLVAAPGHPGIAQSRFGWTLVLASSGWRLYRSSA